MIYSCLRFLLFPLALLLASACTAQDSSNTPSSTTTAPVYLKVQMDKQVRLSKLAPGDVVEGKLARDAYSAQGELFASGTTARLSVDHMEKQRRHDSGRWPWVVGVFTPRWQLMPVFTEAKVSGPHDAVSTLPVSMLFAGTKSDIIATPDKQKKKSKDSSQPAKSKIAPPPTQLLLETHNWNSASTAATSPSESSAASQPEETLEAPPGTRCRILLLDDVRSSTSRANDPVRAVLLEPVMVNHRVLFPAGSTFTGTITKAVKPRMMSRAGNLSISFDHIARPDGMKIPAVSSIVGVEMDSASKMRVDEEGRLHGGPPGLKWILIDGGVAAGLAKVSDDTLQLIIESIVSTATDASTAGSGRIAAACVSGVFLLTRHGRDVRLPKYTEMTVTIERPAPKS